MKAGFLDPGGSGKKKNNTHGEQPAGMKDNTNGLGFGLGFSSLLDNTCTIHVPGDMNDVNAITGGVMGQIPESNVGKINGNDPSNTGPISVTNSSSYAHKLSPSSFTKANLRKLDANVPNEADYDVWLPLVSVHELVDSMLRDGPRMIHRVSIFFNKWSPSVSLLKKELSRVPDWVKFHDVPMVAYTSDGLSPIASKIVKGSGYTKEIIRVEYEWKPPRCGSCLIFGHSDDDCPNAPKQVVKMVDKGKAVSFGVDGDGFIEVKKKKSGEMSSKTAPSIGKTNVSTTGNSLKTAKKTNASKSGYRAVSLRQTSTPIVDKISRIKKHLMEGTCVLLDDDGKPLEKVVSFGDHDSDDEVEPVDNEMANYLASNPSGVGFGTKSLLEQWSDSYGDADYDYDPYDNNMYEG
ncbi:zinc knuckle CX2CX4HX4C containing protein [Tanacetum coccineum]